MRSIVLFCVLMTSVGFAAAQNCAEAAREVRPVLSDETRTLYEKNLADAQATLARIPNDADAIIWYGRRTAYLGRYKDAIRVFSEGISAFPKDARFFRHRGHRYLTLRCFDEAVTDFEKAAVLVKGKPDEVEPDGLPNAKNTPTSTLQSNIWYHLGLAYYLKGAFDKALGAYREAEKVSTNNDMRVATAYWHYMTLRRMGKKRAAGHVLKPFGGEVEVIENDDYLKLVRLNRGENRPETLLATLQGHAKTLSSASLGYGIGNYFLYNGDRGKAIEIFRKIVDGDQWSSFGYIAAEAELKRR